VGFLVVRSGVRDGIPLYDGSVGVLRNFEQELFAQLNESRMAKGDGKILIWDENLGAVARGHSQDMVNRAFFQHKSPDGHSPANRIHQAGIKATASGENIAKATDVESAHTNLMASPGHRQNILASEYTHVGVGIVEDDAGMLVVTELFRRAPATELAQRNP